MLQPVDETDGRAPSPGLDERGRREIIGISRNMDQTDDVPEDPHDAGSAWSWEAPVEGLIKFYKADKGWGAIVSPAVPGDIWVHFSVVATDGGQLEAGDIVDFDVEEAPQTPFRYRATRASLIRHGPAPTLRRQGERVDIAGPGTPDTPLTPKQARRR